jgi:putative DNA primase/helicase
MNDHRAPPKPQTYNGDLSRLPAALTHLRKQRIWVCWRWFWNGKKWTKPPRRTDNPDINASTSDPATWGTHDQAVAQVRAGKADGIGFMLKGLNIGGVDLDHCRNPQSGHVAQWAHERVDRFAKSYLEATVSGKGLRILGVSSLEKFAPKFKLPDKGNGAAIELFSNSNHYLTLSCNEIGSCAKLPAIGEQMQELAAELSTRPAPTNGARVNDAPPPAPRPNDAPHTQPRTPWSFPEDARLRAALAAIPTDEKLLLEKFGSSHNIWVKIGMAIERLGWNDRGYAIFRDWSSQNATEFNEKGLRTQWSSFNRNRNSRKNPVTIGTVFHYARQFGWSGSEKIDQNDGELMSTTVADMEMCGVDWLWPGRFARGKFGLIAGLPDMGKGQIAAFIAAAVTADIELPCNEGSAPQGNVLWFNAEDGPRDTLLPRLVAAGADTTRIHHVNSARVGGKDKTFSLVTDLPLLRKTIERIGNVVLVIIDPVSAYLGIGKVDGRSATDVRGVLSPLKDMAEELHIAVIGIAHFNKKDDIKSALLRVSDSIAYVAAARHVYAVLDDPEDKNSKLFVKAKNNLAPDKNALRYGFGVKTVGHDPALTVDIKAPFIVWHPKHVEITANEAMAAAGSHTAKREAREFLLERLELGPAKADDIIEEANQDGIAKRTLDRAKKELGIKSRKTPSRFNGEWFWELPPKAKAGV